MGLVDDLQYVLDSFPPQIHDSYLFFLQDIQELVNVRFFCKNLLL